MTKHFISTLSIFSVLILLFSCSKDDEKDGKDNQGQQGTATNSISFDISGEIEGSKSGGCYVVTVEAGMYSFMISSNDGNSMDSQTFSLSFQKISGEPIPVPSPGTYPIGTAGEVADNDGFWVVYTDTDSKTDYGSAEVSGKLTITSNSDNQLKGTFEFTAGKAGSSDKITVENGVFSAAID